MLLIDPRQPMSYTSAQSGDNYRNWWPHPTMTAFTNDSIDELDRLAEESDNVFQMSRGGYVLATRRDDITPILGTISDGIDVSVFDRRDTIRSRFPHLSDDIRNVVHIRRGGDISGQQMGQYMLEKIRAAGGAKMPGSVSAIEQNAGYRLRVTTAEGTKSVRADTVVNAAGPFANRVAGQLGIELPIRNVFQQKIAFEDHLQAIPRSAPFSIDLDSKQLNWTAEERGLLEEDDGLAWLADELPSGTHCRPEGGARGKWVKLGWAYNRRLSDPLEDMANEPAIDAWFPEVVIRGAAQFIPALESYIASPPPRFSHYGGYYTMTEENWPLIGPLDGHGAFIIAAMSGFGSMAACAAGKLCAAHICGRELPAYAADLSLARLTNGKLLEQLAAAETRGIL